MFSVFALAATGCALIASVDHEPRAAPWLSAVFVAQSLAWLAEEARDLHRRRTERAARDAEAARRCAHWDAASQVYDRR